MKIRLDRAACTGHGRCYALAPDLFDEDDEGYCVLRSVELTEADLTRARLAVRNCPEEALSLEGVEAGSGDG